MKAAKMPLIIPVEGQVRELDAKLLLTCIAARRGFSSVIGSRKEIHFRIPSFPQSIYLSKSITSGSDKVFGILRKLGHEIVAWDEDALVHLPAETYFSRRLSPTAIKHVCHLLAWGQDNAELWRQYPQLPNGILIHITGNSRGDLLRSEMRAFYEKEVEDLRKAYGDFILINTNFNHVNAFYPSRNLFQPARKPGEQPRFGRAAKGMTREFAEGFQQHKQALFDNFKQLIPALDREFPDYSIIVRPHPVEKHDVYQKIADQCKRVRVTNEGNVVPWLMATKALIHNGCTTGVEAYLIGVPTISYRATVNEFYDLGFYRLPNMLSYQCFDFEELLGTLKSILAGKLGAADGDERRELIAHHVAALDGPLACERIVDVLAQITENRSEELRGPTLRDRLKGWFRASKRTLKKQYKSRFSDSHNRPEFLRHRYPGISLEEIRMRISRFQQVLNDGTEVKIEQIADHIFRISS